MFLRLKKGDPSFNEVKFAALSLKKDKNELRDHVRYLYITEEYICGTDVRMLTVAPNINGLGCGFYEVLKNIKSEIWLVKIKEDGKFPPFEHIIKNQGNNNILHNNITFSVNEIYRNTTGIYDPERIIKVLSPLSNPEFEERGDSLLYIIDCNGYIACIIGMKG